MEWYDININNGAYNGRYKINKQGDVLTLNYNKTGVSKILAKKHTKNDVSIIGLYDDNGKQNWHSVHRLMALTFLERTNDDLEVNHIDEDRSNNCLDNLEWVTKSENINHGTRNERMAQKLRKPIICSNGIIYDSVTSAAKSLKLDPSSISKVCRGKYAHCGGYTFKYKEC